jgi:hypothetical protein
VFLRRAGIAITWVALLVRDHVSATQAVIRHGNCLAWPNSEVLCRTVALTHVAVRLLRPSGEDAVNHLAQFCGITFQLSVVLRQGGVRLLGRIPKWHSI